MHAADLKLLAIRTAAIMSVHSYPQIVPRKEAYSELVAKRELYTIKERLRGYRQIMEESGLSLLIDSTLSDDAASAERSLKSHLADPKPPHAGFTIRHSATIAAFQTLQRLGIPFPPRGTARL
jgi:DNA-binding LacI/PurR family transcriptional regulator